MKMSLVSLAQTSARHNSVVRLPQRLVEFAAGGDNARYVNSGPFLIGPPNVPREEGSLPRLPSAIRPTFCSRPCHTQYTLSKIDASSHSTTEIHARIIRVG